ESIARARQLDAKLLGRWVLHLRSAARDAGDPLHAWAKVAADPAVGDPSRLAELLRPIVAGWRKRTSDAAEALKWAEVVIDYARGRAEDWMPDDVADGTGPVRAGDCSLSEAQARPAIRFFTRGAAELDPVWHALKAAPGAETEPGALGGRVRAGRT